MNYWYKDNWTGAICEFKTLAAAKKAAKSECGTVIYIRKHGSDEVCIVEASGYCYP